MRNTVSDEEIVKWLTKIENVLPNIEADTEKGEEMLTNMNAYIADCKHFRKNEELVLSFESIVWAWAIFELARDLGHFKVLDSDAEKEPF